MISFEPFPEVSFKVRDVDRSDIFCGGLHITSGELRYWEEFDYQLGDIEVCMFVETCRDGTRRNGPCWAAVAGCRESRCRLMTRG